VPAREGFATAGGAARRRAALCPEPLERVRPAWLPMRSSPKRNGWQDAVERGAEKPHNSAKGKRNESLVCSTPRHSNFCRPDGRGARGLSSNLVTPGRGRARSNETPGFPTQGDKPRHRLIGWSEGEFEPLVPRGKGAVLRDHSDRFSAGSPMRESATPRERDREFDSRSLRQRSAPVTRQALCTEPPPSRQPFLACPMYELSRTSALPERRSSTCLPRGKGDLAFDRARSRLR